MSTHRTESMPTHDTGSNGFQKYYSAAAGSRMAAYSTISVPMHHP